MKDSELREHAKNFAISVITACDDVDVRKGRGVLVNQITKSATSIGANIHEANYAASRADFVNKMKIALKECFETEYWIGIMQAAGCITGDIANKLMNDCGVIRKMLVKSVNTVQNNDLSAAE